MDFRVRQFCGLRTDEKKKLRILQSVRGSLCTLSPVARTICRVNVDLIAHTGR